MFQTAQQQTAAAGVIGLGAFGDNKPGFLPADAADLTAGWRNRHGELRVPLAITLPAMVAVSAGMWAGIWMAVRAVL